MNKPQPSNPELELRSLLQEQPERVAEIAIELGAASRLVSALVELDPVLAETAEDAADPPEYVRTLETATGPVDIEGWNDDGQWVFSVKGDPGLVVQAESESEAIGQLVALLADVA